MHANADDCVACAACETRLPEYVDACLRGAPVAALFPAVYRHLAHCAACSLLVAEVVSVIRWREAAEPFNAHVLPLASPLTGAGPAGDLPYVQ